MTSDHLPIRGSVPSRTLNEAYIKRPLKVTKEKLPHFGRLVSQWIEPVDSINSTQGIDDATENIYGVLKNAVKAVGNRSNVSNSRCAPWWTPECKIAHQNYKTPDKISEYIRQRKFFRSVVASVKREHWKKRVETMKSSSETFRLMRWVSARHDKLPPPFDTKVDF